MSSELKVAPAQGPVAAPETTRNVPLWRPLTDVVETREGLMLMIEMPGVAPENVEISLEKRVLTIRGRAQGQQPERLRAVHLEYEPGDYERAFALAADFDAERIEAAMRNGVLTLTLPRVAEAQPRTIRVKAA